MRWDRRNEEADVRRPRFYEEANDYGQADYDTDYAYDAGSRAGYRAAEPYADRADFGQVDYSATYGYDPRLRSGYRRDAVAESYDARREVEDRRDRERLAEPRSWFGGERRQRARDRDHDRALWGAVTARLAYDRRLDASDIHVTAENGVVILEGTVRNRHDRERAEDLAEVRGAHYVRNNLHVRERRGWF